MFQTIGIMAKFGAASIHELKKVANERLPQHYRVCAGRPTKPRQALNTLNLDTLYGHWGGGNMTNLQAFALGLMVAWTPSLVLLAYFLWRTPLLSKQERVRLNQSGT